MTRIMDAFTEGAIEAADTNVGDDEENELREVIREIYRSNRIELSKDEENVGVLCFVAGRTYQVQSEPEFTIPMNLVGPFMEFLVQMVQRGEP